MPDNSLSAPATTLGAQDNSCHVRAVSGLGAKSPAAFLVEYRGKRLLMDLGAGPEPGVRPDLTGLGQIDAICLSHAHGDHVGALDARGDHGNPPVWATAATWGQIDTALVPQEARRLLPLKGSTEVLGTPVMTGRTGHAPGGVWLHLPGAGREGGGFTYMGDWTVESDLFPFDMPPQADFLIDDASYGNRDQSLADQIGALAEAAREGAVLCVPAAGRGPEMALRLAALGLRPLPCPVIRREIEALATDDSGIIDAAPRAAMAALLKDGQLAGGAPTPQDIVITTDANAESGLAADLLARREEGFRFIFTGYVPPGTPAERLVAAKQALWCGWNVHPCLGDMLWLQREIKPRWVMPAFVKPASASKLAEASHATLLWEPGFRF
ncbi:MBL fold metallo-hydrolase [Radicibacter daui]|uniref:MBL fold metallo-hydrolase n=1 Tax=Radicibacter daui TaxID=3064829 RepID=UPI004046B46D